MGILPVSKFKLRFDQSDLKSGGHILYMFNEIDKYLVNAVDFIYEGIMKGEVVLLIDTDETITSIHNKLDSMGITNKQLDRIITIKSDEFYLDEIKFNAVETAKRLHNLLQPYKEKGYSVRVWGHVTLSIQASLVEQVTFYECNSDDFLEDRSIICVCCYSGLKTPAYIQNELLKTHEYFMMDDEFSLSPLYNKQNHKCLCTKEIERLQKIEKQVKELEDKNNQLATENSFEKLKKEIFKQGEGKLRTIINELPIPVIIRSKCRILFYNNVAQEQFYINDQNLIEEATLNSFFEKYDFHFLKSSRDKIHEHQIILNNDEKKFYIVKSIDILFESKTAILHAFVDITQEKENENLIIRSEKMNIAGELAASIAHELRNPLTSIKGFFHILKNTGEGKEMYYSIIEDELSRIEQIASELLTLAKPHTQNQKQHNIVHLINEVVILLTPEANLKNIEISLLANSEDVIVKCTATNIKQFFINMIKNAIDSMPNGGNLVIKINELKDATQIQIIDQGIGISEELLNKLGEPFYTTKEKGTGIGLMVCYQIIERHGGTIHVDSRINRGTTFTITLPTIKENGNV